MRAEFEAEFRAFYEALTKAEESEPTEDLGKESLNEQVLRAGEFGYQQDKLKLTKLLEKLFG
jgi:hypothetical protein